MSGRLEALGKRLEYVLRDPEAIEAQLLFRIARPLFALAGWRASLQVTALTELIAHVREGGMTVEPAASLLEAGLRELEANVNTLERVAIVRKRVPVAHVLWLRRVCGVLALAERACEAPADDALQRWVAKTDPSVLLPPLVPRTADSAPLELPMANHPEVEDARLVDLELAAIDHLIAAARAETIVVGRRRRLLVAARQRLLEAAAALPLGREGVSERTTWLAREITRLDRLQGAGLDPDVSLLHQARQALVRRDPARLYAALAAIDAHALSAGDEDVSARCARAFATVHRHGSPDAPASSLLSARQLLGDVGERVSSAIDHARAGAHQQTTLGGSQDDHKTAREYLAYLPENADREILRAAVAADGFFEVGGALAAVRVAEEQRVRRLVRHPTQELALVPGGDASDLRDAVIGDPRTVLLDLATGRLFARRFVRDDVVTRSRVVMHGEVRVYVLDGSGSMKGARARVRDAILVAELSTLIGRLEAPGDTRCALLYRYFDEQLGRETRIDTVKAARDAIRDVVTTQRAGGTDIQRALLASLERIAEARAADPMLARAQIVLVTDGESEIDETAIVSARDAIVGVPIGVSVIALGEENAALRGLVARQRAKGESAFYHYLDDAELAAITSGQLDEAIHPPTHWLEQDPELLAHALDEEVAGLVDDLEHLDRARDHAALERLEEESQARREVGLPGGDMDDATGDGLRARTEALRKDRVALAARYARWFPDVRDAGAQADLPAPRTRERDDIDAVSCALASVAEVVVLLGGSALARQGDAINLLERLLPDAGLSPAHYRAIVRQWPHAVAPALRALRDAVEPPK